MTPEEQAAADSAAAAAEAAEVAATTTPADAGDDGATRDAGDTGAGPVPYLRFRERNERAKRYEPLGEPDEIAEKLHRLTGYERQEAEAAERRRVAQEGAGEAALSTDEQQAMRVMERLLDHLPPQAVARLLEKVRPGTAQRLLRLPEQQQAYDESYAVDAFREMRDALTGYEGITTDDDTLDYYATLVEGEIRGDRKLWTSYGVPAERAQAMQTAVGRVITKRVNPLLLAQGARAIERATARRATTLSRLTQSGTPAAATPKEFKSTHETGTLAYERDRRAFRNQEIDAALASIGEDSG